MSKSAEAAPGSSGTVIDLKDPYLAAFLAWLLPGLGHFYQGRIHKAVLYAVCILGTFFFGLYLGEGRVVYASFTREDNRLPYLCQVGVGLPALPALVQMRRFRDPEVRARATQNLNAGKAHWSDWFMAPPDTRPTHFGGRPGADELDHIYYRMNRYFELGTVFTMIAGLLNILAIYDAFGGPMYGDEPPPGTRRKDDDAEPSSPDSAAAKTGGGE